MTAMIAEFPWCVAQAGSKRPWSSVLVRLPKSVHQQAAEAAERDGTSLNQFILAAVAEKVGIEEGPEVAVSVDGGDIGVSPRRSPAYRLEDLVEGTTPDNLHAEVPLGPSVGGEAW